MVVHLGRIRVVARHRVVIGALIVVHGVLEILVIALLNFAIVTRGVSIRLAVVTIGSLPIAVIAILTPILVPRIRVMHAALEIIVIFLLRIGDGIVGMLVGLAGII